MARPVAELVVEITARLDKLEVALKSAERKTEESARRMDRQLGGIGKSLGNLRSQFNVAIAGIAGLGASIDRVSRSIGAMSEAWKGSEKNIFDNRLMVEKLGDAIEQIPIVGPIGGLARRGFAFAFPGLEREELEIPNLQRQSARERAIIQALTRVSEIERNIQLREARDPVERARLQVQFAIREAESLLAAARAGDIQIPEDVAKRLGTALFKDAASQLQAAIREEAKRRAQELRQRADDIGADGADLEARQRGIVGSVQTAIGRFRVGQKVDIELRKQTVLLTSIDRNIDRGIKINALV